MTTTSPTPEQDAERGAALRKRRDVIDEMLGRLRAERDDINDELEEIAWRASPQRARRARAMGRRGPIDNDPAPSLPRGDRE